MIDEWKLCAELCSPGLPRYPPRTHRRGNTNVERVPYLHSTIFFTLDENIALTGMWWLHICIRPRVSETSALNSFSKGNLQTDGIVYAPDGIPERLAAGLEVASRGGFQFPTVIDAITYRAHRVCTWGAITGQHRSMSPLWRLHNRYFSFYPW